MDIIAVIKAHPIPIGIGVVILLLLIRSGGATKTTNSGSSVALQSQQLAVQSNSQIAGINSATSIALGAQSVERYRIGESDALARTQTAASVISTMMGATLQRDLTDSAAMNKVVLAGVARSTNSDNIAASLQSQNAEINSKIRINSDTLAAQISRNNSDNNFKLAQIGQQTQGSLAIISGVGTQAQIMADKNNAYAASTLPSLMAHAEAMATITGQNAFQIVQQQTKAANTTADANANAVNTKSDQSWISSIASVIGSFF